MPSPLHHQSHAARMRHIEQLRREHGTGRKRKSVVAMPDLSCATTDGREPAPRSDTVHHKFSSARRGGAYHEDAKQFPSANLFKQGPQLITPGDIASGRHRDFGGHKPNKGSFGSSDV